MHYSLKCVLILVQGKLMIRHKPSKPHRLTLTTCVIDSMPLCNAHNLKLGLRQEKFN